VRVRGGDDSDVVSAVVLHQFKMRRKKKKKKKKKNLSNCPCGAKCVRRWHVCVRGKLEMKGTKDLLFFLRGGTRYGERWWLMSTHEACRGGCNGAAGVPQKGDMTAMGSLCGHKGKVAAVAVSQPTLSCTSSK